MSDLIKLTESEHDWLYNLLPNNIRSVQLYQQPALNEFCVNYLHDSGLTTRFVYRRGNAFSTSSWEITTVRLEDLDVSTIITCTFEDISPDGTKSSTQSLVFGFKNNNTKDVIVINPKTAYWDIIKQHGWHQEQTRAIVWLYEAIQYLLLHHKELLQFSVTKEPSKHSGKKKSGKSKKSPPKKTKLYRLVHMSDEQADELKKTIAAECEKCKRERLCSAWGVRGHYRHYKSGKVAYIKPHVRGKEKEKYAGREYALFPQNVTS